eukprot:1347070-Lingulodinium_polyedra.AAC.1
MARALDGGPLSPSVDPGKRKAKVIGSVRVESERPLSLARVVAEGAAGAVMGRDTSPAKTVTTVEV